MTPGPADDLTADERARLAPHVTDLDGPVFALTNLPEVVKGALFARYSRSSKSLRRLLLDEFLPPDGGPPAAPPPAQTGSERAEALYGRVLADYGDDSVAQLGAAHIAVEGASNVLTKVIEWGRLASYLEQSTRYISFAERVGGRFRYHEPAELTEHPELAARYRQVLDEAFTVYGELIPRMVEEVDRRMPPAAPGDENARPRAVRAAALDLLRGLLPAATTANVGVFASGQAYEAMLVRMAAHPLAEARECAARMLVQLRAVIPAFLTRVDRPDRGVAQGAYMADADRRAAAMAAEVSVARPAETGPSVRLLDFDPDGELRVLAQAVWPFCGGRLAEARSWVGGLGHEERARLLREWAGERMDRRWRPGRALECTSYTFEVVCDYGAYRDLQRHRMLTLLAQPLGPELGYEVPAGVERAGAGERYARVQEASAALARAVGQVAPAAAPYAVSLGHRIRFVMTMNAREAMHLIELRSQPQGHDAYRWVAREMHRLIGSVAGHDALAALMDFVDREGAGGGRLEAERRAERRRAGGA